MRKIVLITSFAILIVVTWFGESRKFICLDQGKCVTVWKTYNNTCYIIPGKYWGFTRPISNNYVQTTNLGSLDVIWQNGNRDLIVDVDDSAKIINQSSEISSEPEKKM